MLTVNLSSTTDSQLPSQPLCYTTLLSCSIRGIQCPALGHHDSLMAREELCHLRIRAYEGGESATRIWTQIYLQRGLPNLDVCLQVRTPEWPLRESMGPSGKLECCVRRGQGCTQSCQSCSCFCWYRKRTRVHQMIIHSCAAASTSSQMGNEILEREELGLYSSIGQVLV